METGNESCVYITGLLEPIGNYRTATLAVNG